MINHDRSVDFENTLFRDLKPIQSKKGGEKKNVYGYNRSRNCSAFLSFTRFGAVPA